MSLERVACFVGARIAASIAAGLTACAVVGCGYSRIRTTYVLDRVEGLAISSSPAVYEQLQPRVYDGRLAFDYPLFAENHDASTAELDLVAARAMLMPESDLEKAEPFRAECREHTPGRRSAPVTVLAPGARVRVDCTVEIPRAQMAKVYNADREILLGVPVRAGGQSRLVVFSYALFAGDTR
jgi:hypothetical protein